MAGPLQLARLVEVSPQGDNDCFFPNLVQLRPKLIQCLAWNVLHDDAGHSAVVVVLTLVDGEDFWNWMAVDLATKIILCPSSGFT
jgi:hypothetical protein